MKLMVINLSVMLVVFVLLVIFNIHLGGGKLAMKGLAGSGKYFAMVMIIVMPLALMAGQISALYGKSPETVRSVISGRMGIYKALAVGTLVPGGMSAGPVFQEEWKRNVSSRFAIIVLLIASGTINWTGVMIKLPFLGPKITSIMLAISVGMMVSMILIFTIIQYFRGH